MAGAAHVYKPQILGPSAGLGYHTKKAAKGTALGVTLLLSLLATRCLPCPHTAILNGSFMTQFPTHTYFGNSA